MSDRFQILSLDGGGIKGLFSAAVLAAIEDDLEVNITDHFDLIAGTSTGGIIALGLGMGLSPKEIVDFYTTQGTTIFNNPIGWRSLLNWCCRKYPQKGLREALQSPSFLGDKKLGESNKRLVIPSYNLGENDVYLFKTPHHERLKHDWKIPAWQVALATSAAPTYFPASQHVDHIRHIDGGVWANNPVLVSIVEAVSLLNVSMENIHILSLGTSDAVVHHPKRLNWAGKLFWANHVVELIMKGQSTGANTQAKHLLGGDRVLRIDPKVPSGLFNLDGTSGREALLGKAAHESRGFMPEIKTRFMSHRAVPYSPRYPESKEARNEKEEVE